MYSAVVRDASTTLAAQRLPPLPLNDGISMWNAERLEGLLRRIRTGTALPEERTFQEALFRTIDILGARSKIAQGVNSVLTTVAKLRENRDYRLYILIEGHLGMGILKVGTKKLFVTHPMKQHLVEVQPLCVLDFYVSEQVQRSGFGRRLFNAMLQEEQLLPSQLAIDRPSSKLISFMKRHYGLQSFTPQTNNFVVYHEFFNNTMVSDRGQVHRAVPVYSFGDHPDACCGGIPPYQTPPACSGGGGGGGPGMENSPPPPPRMPNGYPTNGDAEEMGFRPNIVQMNAPINPAAGQMIHGPHGVTPTPLRSSPGRNFLADRTQYLSNDTQPSLTPPPSSSSGASSYPKNDNPGEAFSACCCAPPSLPACACGGECGGDRNAGAYAVPTDDNTSSGACGEVGYDCRSFRPSALPLSHGRGRPCECHSTTSSSCCCQPPSCGGHPPGLSCCFPPQKDLREEIASSARLIDDQKSRREALEEEWRRYNALKEAELEGQIDHLPQYMQRKYRAQLCRQQQEAFQERQLQLEQQIQEQEELMRQQQQLLDEENLRLQEEELEQQRMQKEEAYCRSMREQEELLKMQQEEMRKQNEELLQANRERLQKLQQPPHCGNGCCDTGCSPNDCSCGGGCPEHTPPFAPPPPLASSPFGSPNDPSGGSHCCCGSGGGGKAACCGRSPGPTPPYNPPADDDTAFLMRGEGGAECSRTPPCAASSGCSTSSSCCCGPPPRTPMYRPCGGCGTSPSRTPPPQRGGDFVTTSSAYGAGSLAHRMECGPLTPERPWECTGAEHTCFPPSPCRTPPSSGGCSTSCQSCLPPAPGMTHITTAPPEYRPDPPAEPVPRPLLIHPTPPCIPLPRAADSWGTPPPPSCAPCYGGLTTSSAYGSGVLRHPMGVSAPPTVYHPVREPDYPGANFSKPPAPIYLMDHPPCCTYPHTPADMVHLREREEALQREENLLDHADATAPMNPPPIEEEAAGPMSWKPPTPPPPPPPPRMPGYRPSLSPVPSSTCSGQEILGVQSPSLGTGLGVLPPTAPVPLPPIPFLPDTPDVRPYPTAENHRREEMTDYAYGGPNRFCPCEGRPNGPGPFPHAPYYVRQFRSDVPATGQLCPHNDLSQSSPFPLYCRMDEPDYPAEKGQLHMEGDGKVHRTGVQGGLPGSYWRRQYGRRRLPPFTNVLLGDENGYPLPRWQRSLAGILERDGRVVQAEEEEAEEEARWQALQKPPADSAVSVMPLPHNSAMEMLRDNPDATKAGTTVAVPPNGAAYWPYGVYNYPRVPAHYHERVENPMMDVEIRGGDESGTARCGECVRECETGTENRLADRVRAASALRMAVEREYGSGGGGADDPPQGGDEMMLPPGFPYRPTPPLLPPPPAGFRPPDYGPSEATAPKHVTFQEPEDDPGVQYAAHENLFHTPPLRYSDLMESARDDAKVGFARNLDVGRHFESASRGMRYPAFSSALPPRGANELGGLSHERCYPLQKNVLSPLEPYPGRRNHALNPLTPNALALNTDARLRHWEEAFATPSPVTVPFGHRNALTSRSPGAERQFPGHVDSMMSQELPLLSLPPLPPAARPFRADSKPSLIGPTSCAGFHPATGEYCGPGVCGCGRCAGSTFPANVTLHNCGGPTSHDPPITVPNPVFLSGMNPHAPRTASINYSSVNYNILNGAIS